MHDSLARQCASAVFADGAALPAAVTRLARPLGRALRAGLASAEAAAFWLAALFPLAYLPLLAALQYGALDPGAVAGLGAANLLALLVGHGHEPAGVERDRAAHAAGE